VWGTIGGRDIGRQASAGGVVASAPEAARRPGGRGADGRRGRRDDHTGRRRAARPSAEGGRPAGGRARGRGGAPAGGRGRTQHGCRTGGRPGALDGDRACDGGGIGERGRVRRAAAHGCHRAGRSRFGPPGRVGGGDRDGVGRGGRDRGG